MPMNIDDERFEPLATEGNHPRRTQHLEDVPVSGVDSIGGHVNIMAWADDSGLTYEQTEPVGENHHRYLNDHTTGIETRRPA